MELKKMPALKDFLAEAKHSHAVTLSSQVLSDYDTPSSLFRKLNGTMLLESVDKGESVGRHSIIGVGEVMRITLRGRTITLSEQWLGLSAPIPPEEISAYQNPLLFLREYFLTLTKHSDQEGGSDPFNGGLIGYLGYETIQYFEKIKCGRDVLGLPDGIMVFPRLVAVYDSVSRNVTLHSIIVTRCRDPHAPWIVGGGERNFRRLHNSELTTAYHQSRKLLSDATHAIYHSSNLSLYAPVIKDAHPELLMKHAAKDFVSNMDEDTYAKGVRALIEHIRNGEIIQAVLSKRYSLNIKCSGFELYRTLKAINPSPFLYYLDFGTFEIVGSSPEVMVHLQGENVMIKPIAGSIRRGNDHNEDQRLARELLCDAKECAEHLMLVDLGRNDISRVCLPGSVSVEEYMKVERYSQIQHIVSTVLGKRKPQTDALDLIAATFPAGTLSGAPKIRAMEIISEIEHDKRGPYGGMIFNLSLSGDLNSCICIRTFVIQENALHVQVGSGIVLESDVVRENAECFQKAKALMKAYDQTRNRLKSANTSHSSHSSHSNNTLKQPY